MLITCGLIGNTAITLPKNNHYMFIGCETSLNKLKTFSARSNLIGLNPLYQTSFPDLHYNKTSLKKEIKFKR